MRCLREKATGVALLGGGLLHDDEDETTAAPFGAAEEDGLAGADDGIAFDEDFFILPELEVDIEAAAFCGALVVDFEAEVFGGDDP